ncbi:uncharacterized protein KY384_001508 [Bacidia gigantensis]|uniref:uncharacterized protein n=1 Tax=Bacidia gigantensis TaxID=2732470 RepID=UPI001D04FEDB|nr:uncharacterized protein KY384_001508 [Bacidia gigantensis]KAG8533767.1 hypothetical protein KY384_001508 [Bacidia gigantensis]
MRRSLILFVLHLVVAAATNGTNPTNVSNATASGRRQGWVSQPDGRGTFDILWSSLFTIFLCTWTSLHLNVPAPKEKYWQQCRRKFRWMLQAIMGPEFVVAFATGQKAEARRSVELWHGHGYTKWTLRHGFYANMGGFIIRPRDSKPFPVNARQLHYLVTRNYIPYPDITEKQVWDKSKQDGFQKTLTLLQTGWFVIQCLGRAIQHLPVTTLELTTFSFVFCTFASYYQWSNKPLDVEAPTELDCEASTETILREAGSMPDAHKPYRQTPLDFVDNLSPSWLTEIQPHLYFRTGPRERPLPRFTNDRIPVIGASPDAVLLFIIMLAYCCLHFIAWNFSFPTKTERTLWRAGCIAIVASTFVFLACEAYQDGHRLGRWDRWYIKLFPNKQGSIKRMNTMEQRMREREFIPMWEFISMSPVTFVYAVARAYIVVEVFVSLRSLPVRAFNSVEWSEFIPHF